jgi:DNA-binding MarR family transcriptional regulator
VRSRSIVWNNTDVTDNTPWLDKDQEQSWRAIVIGMKLLRDRLDANLRQSHGISLAEYEVLIQLSEHDGQLRMAQLADAMAHSRSRITHTISRMQVLGLVERTESPADGRGVIAKLTDEGMALLVKAAPVHVTGVRNYLVDVFDPKDLRAAGRGFEAVCAYLVGHHPDQDTLGSPG